MNSSNLSKAFRLIYEYRVGLLGPNSMIAIEQEELLRILCDDLIPNHTFRLDELDELIPRLAQIDSFWNKSTMVLSDEYYTMLEDGNKMQAEALRQKFLLSCPSTWYREIANSL